MNSSITTTPASCEPRERDQGFTLTEILIVLVILGILAATVVFAVRSMSADAATSSCKTDLQTVETAVEAYKAQMGNYPDGATTGGTGVQTDSDAVTVNAASARSGSGSELLQASTASASDPNLTVTPTAGPWLKDIPSDPNHYTITVKNDGSGIISVLNPAGVSGRDCSAIS